MEQLLKPRVDVVVQMPPGLTLDALAVAWADGARTGLTWGVAAGIVVGLLLGWMFFGRRS